MKTPAIPFVLLAMMLYFYLYTPEDRIQAIRKRIRDDINFYLQAELLLIAVTLISVTWNLQKWLGWIAWIVLLVTLPVCYRRLFPKSPPKG